MKRTTLLAGALLFALFANVGCTADSETSAKEPGAMSKNITDLVKIDQKVGDGAEAQIGNTVKVHYTGWLYDPDKPEGHGSKFDSSLDRGNPFEFFLGGGQVIQGWDDGVQGMKVGGKRTLIIPSHMAYGERGAGGVIPPGATLVFDVQLLGIK